MSTDAKVRITLFADHPGSDASDFLLIQAWLEKWVAEVKVANYSSGGWEHHWDVEAPRQAIREVPKRFFCASEWATYPEPLGGAEDQEWGSHFDDGKE